jgi:hypothetical protein
MIFLASAAVMPLTFVISWKVAELISTLPVDLPEPPWTEGREFFLGTFLGMGFGLLIGGGVGSPDAGGVISPGAGVGVPPEGGIASPGAGVVGAEAGGVELPDDGGGAPKSGGLDGWEVGISPDEGAGLLSGVVGFGSCALTARGNATPIAQHRERINFLETIANFSSFNKWTDPDWNNADVSLSYFRTLGWEEMFRFLLLVKIK